MNLLLPWLVCSYGTLSTFPIYKRSALDANVKSTACPSGLASSTQMAYLGPQYFVPMDHFSLYPVMYTELYLQFRYQKSFLAQSLHPFELTAVIASIHTPPKLQCASKTAKHCKNSMLWPLSDWCIFNHLIAVILKWVSNLKKCSFQQHKSVLWSQ